MSDHVKLLWDARIWFEVAKTFEAQADRIAELKAALANARQEGMEEAAKIAADYEIVAYQHGNLPISDPNECAAQAAREIAASIRNAMAERKE